MTHAERVARIDDLRELIKYERQHQLAALIDNPRSDDTWLHSISLAAMEKELAEHLGEVETERVA